MTADRREPVWPSDAWKITRRSFLALCLAGCSQLARRPTEGEPLRIEQTWALLSDTHISSNRKRSAGGSCMAANLERVVADVIAAKPDQVLFCGDIAFFTGKAEDYAAFRELIAPLRDQSLPLHFIPGNHDRRDRLVEALSLTPDPAVPDKVVSVATIGHIQWFFLDSLDPKSPIRGMLGPEQRAWLARQLDAAGGPAIVCLHHNPEWSPVGLKDTREFLDVLRPRRRVKLVLFGHTHVFRLWQADGLHFVNLPATGHHRVDGTGQLGWVRADIGDHGVRLELRGITSRERYHGTTHELRWRSEA